MSGGRPDRARAVAAVVACQAAVKDLPGRGAAGIAHGTAWGPICRPGKTARWDHAPLQVAAPTPGAALAGLRRGAHDYQFFLASAAGRDSGRRRGARPRRPAAASGRMRCRRLPGADLALLFLARAAQYIGSPPSTSLSGVDMTV